MNSNEINSPELKKRSQKEIANEKSQRVLEGVAYWGAFYRLNPQRFVKDYLNVTLKLFQKILIYFMMSSNHFMFLAARSLGKTWLTALFCVVRCILFPKTKICIASGTRSQANEFLDKIASDFCKNYGWGSDNLKREISYCVVSPNKAIVEFYNGSWIKVVTSSDSARGNRANLLVLDEFRMIDLDTINTVLRRFLGTPRQPRYLDFPEYKHLLESNIEIYMSSAWYKIHWSYGKVKSYISNMLNPSLKYFICALPYQVSIKEGLLMREQIEAEMSEADFDEIKFQMEMEVNWFGDTEGSFFKFDDINNRRKLLSAMYPPSISDKVKVPKIPDLAFNERRILSVDVALMASTKRKDNDAACIVINSAIPTNSNKYVSNIVYLENHEGLVTDDLALVVRRLFQWYKCTDLVIDAGGNGAGVYDALIKDIIDPNTGELYSALSCRNDKDMAARCKVEDAPKVIWSIKASQQFNSQCCVFLRSAFKQGNINLLISEQDFDTTQGKNIKGYARMTAEEQYEYKKPYIQTTLLIYELINLEYEVNGNNYKVFEKSKMRKDRYSSLSYNYWVQYQLEQELLQVKKSTFSISDYVDAMKKLARKPRQY